MATRQFISSTLSNLVGGAKLTLLLPVTRQHFCFSQTQLIAMLLLGFTLDIAGDWLEAIPPIEFNYYGISYLLSLYFANLASLYIISLIHRQTQLFYQLLILQYASYPIVFMVSLLITAPISETTDLISTSIILILLLCWSLIILFRAISLLFSSHWWLISASFIVYTAINLSAIMFIPGQPLWYGDLSAADDARLKSVNTENTYYKQLPLLQDALHFVQKGDPSKEEYFFMGFAPDASQDVFLKESLAVQGLMDEHFDTRERSLLLANHLDTYLDHPLANAHNLHVALNSFAQKMDGDDILMLFLTSHGSKTYELSVNFANMQFNDLPASKLANMLDNSGIKWRVIVVSACYSGGLIDKLKNPQSLIITAAARDRQSAGCTNNSVATWFTDAYFKQALTETGSFIGAFDLTKKLIHQREQQAGMEFSNPQLFIGDEIRTKLSRNPVK